MKVLTKDPPQNVEDKYEIDEIIGTGSFGVVRKCRDRSTGEIFAVKTIRKSRVEDVDVLRNEIEILSEVDHPHIIKLQDVFEDDKDIHIVTEYCTGGELYDRVIELAESDEQHFQEVDAARIISNILSAIAYCHDVKHIVHRDLKPENFLLLHNGEDSPVKIIDFGLSRHDTSSKWGIMNTRVGSPYYVAPEVLTMEYTNKCDIWSIGVIAYLLLCGFPPFGGDTDYDIIRSVEIFNDNVDFPSPEWDDISSDAKNFVKALLQKNPTKRPTAREAMQHAWIVKNVPDVQAQMNAETTKLGDDVEPPLVAEDKDMEKENTKSTGAEEMPTMRMSDIPAVKHHSHSDGDLPIMDDIVSLPLDGPKQRAFQNYLSNNKLKKALSAVVYSLSPTKERGLLDDDVFKDVDANKDGTVVCRDIDTAVEQVGDFLAPSVKTQLLKLRDSLPFENPAMEKKQPFTVKALLKAATKAEMQRKKKMKDEKQKRKEKLCKSDSGKVRHVHDKRDSLVKGTAKSSRF